MPKKITQLAPAAIVNDDDLLTFARPPFGPTDNFSCTLPQLLYRVDVAAKIFGSNGGTLTFDTAGQAVIDIPPGQGFLVQVDGVIVAEFLNGGVELTSDVGKAVGIDGALGSQLIVHDDSIELTSGPGGLVDVQYDDDNPPEWSGGSPATLSDAVNRIRSAVAGLLGGPIP